MSSTTREKLDLLRSKIALAMGPSEHNMAWYSVKYIHPNALDEPWSTDMSGPYTYAVLDNKTFKLVEVADEQLAVDITRAYRPIDAGENIKLYLHDVYIIELFQMLGLDMAEVRNPVTGEDPYGPYYLNLVKAINESILKKENVEDVTTEGGISETVEATGGDDNWATTDSSEGTEDKSSYEDAQENPEVDDGEDYEEL